MSASITLPVLVFYMCTAYTASIDECGKDDGITASMTKATAGRTIAADDLPFGTKVKINGHIYTVEDRFGAGHKHRIDIFMNTKEEAFQYGRRIELVEVIKEDPKEEQTEWLEANFPK